MNQKERNHSFLEESVIEYPPYRFLITKVPSDASMNEYIRLLKEHNVSIVIRACEATYSQAPLEEAGIQVLDFNFPDGSGPPKHIVQKWLALLNEVYVEKKKENEGKTIALHCVAGLGRAPVLKD
jgi:protein tyrosine phosphatase type 4A